MPSFTAIFEPETTNASVFDTVVSPTIEKVLDGNTCNFFAYGHSGSGKTHTVIGYDYEHDEHLGLCLATARKLFAALAEINGTVEDDMEKLKIGLRIFEIRKKSAFDLMNGKLECHIRESDGKVHVRGETEMLDGGKVRVQPIVTRACGSYDDFRDRMLEGLKMRASGTSTVHDESSRTHAVLEMEIVNQTLLSAWEAVVARHSELVPIGARATDVYIEESMASLIKTEDGKYIQNPDRPIDQARIDAAEAEKAVYEARLAEAEGKAAELVSQSRQHRCLGGKFVFVDLAGSEYYDQNSNSTQAIKQTPQEKVEGRQINSDLFALKEVIRARSLGQSRIPYRSSPLTMVLREHFEGQGSSAMILTAASDEDQMRATENTLKYGGLVGSK